MLEAFIHLFIAVCLKVATDIIEEADRFAPYIESNKLLLLLMLVVVIVVVMVVVVVVVVYIFTYIHTYLRRYT